MVRFDPEQVMLWLNSGDQGSGIDSRQRQLAALASDGGDDAECASADLLHEYPQQP